MAPHRQPRAAGGLHGRHCAIEQHHALSADRVTRAHTAWGHRATEQAHREEVAISRVHGGSSRGYRARSPARSDSAAPASPARTPGCPPMRRRRGPDRRGTTADSRARVSPSGCDRMPGPSHQAIATRVSGPSSRQLSDVIEARPVMRCATRRRASGAGPRRMTARTSEKYRSLSVSPSGAGAPASRARLVEGRGRPGIAVVREAPSVGREGVRVRHREGHAGRRLAEMEQGRIGPDGGRGIRERRVGRGAQGLLAHRNVTAGIDPADAPAVCVLARQCFEAGQLHGQQAIGRGRDACHDTQESTHPRHDTGIEPPPNHSSRALLTIMHRGSLRRDPALAPRS